LRSGQESNLRPRGTTALAGCARNLRASRTPILFPMPFTEHARDESVGCAARRQHNIGLTQSLYHCTPPRHTSPQLSPLARGCAWNPGGFRLTIATSIPNRAPS